MQEQQKDHYGLLGIAPNSPETVIRKVYRRLALKYHPDKNADDANAPSNFKTLQEAYDVLINAESRRIYDQKREAWGTIPSEFLAPAPKRKPPESEPIPDPDPGNAEAREAFRKALLREKLKAERLRIEKEKQELEEAAQRKEQERLQVLAAERIRAAREAAEEDRRLEEERKKQARDQEIFHRMAAERIRAQRDHIAQEEARKKEAEEDARRRRREEEEELAENLRQSKLKPPKGITPNSWSDAEIDCLLQWKRQNITWAVIAVKMNELFDSDRSPMSCRKKYIKLERAGEI